MQSQMHLEVVVADGTPNHLLTESLGVSAAAGIAMSTMYLSTCVWITCFGSGVSPPPRQNQERRLAP